MRILVVEGQRVLADAIADGLRRQAMAVDVAYDGNAANRQLDLNDYDVVVLDRDMPGAPGDTICRSVANAATETKVLMLTASEPAADGSAALSLGADDYLPKPFAFAELVARVRALGRSRHLPRVLCRAGIRLDPTSREVFRDGRRVRLSRKECAVLEQLLRADGAVLPAEQILRQVWDQNVSPFSNVLRVTVMTLRRKLGEPPVVQTVPGIGYRIR